MGERPSAKSVFCLIQRDALRARLSLERDLGQHIELLPLLTQQPRYLRVRLVKHPPHLCIDQELS